MRTESQSNIQNTISMFILPILATFFCVFNSFFANSPGLSKHYLQYSSNQTSRKKKKRGRKREKRVLRPSIELGTTVSRFVANIRACAKFVNRFSNGPCMVSPGKSSRSTELYFFSPRFRESIRQTLYYQTHQNTQTRQISVNVQFL